MNRESMRLTGKRAAALLVTVLLHAFLIGWMLLLRPLTPPAAPAREIRVVWVENVMKLRAEAELSPLQMTQPKPVRMSIATPNVHIPFEPPPPQAIASETTADASASVVASNAIPSISSEGSGPESKGEAGDFIVAHRVQPIYSDASVRAREEGYVVIGLLVDERGRVRRTAVIQSSGFRSLDQSAVDALRQWTFTRSAGAAGGPAWTSFRYGFHLASPNTLDLSEINLALLSYEPELNQQVRAAVVPSPPSTTPKPRGAATLRRLIAAIQLSAPTVGRNIVGPMPPVQRLVKLGAVKSVQFVGLGSHGLEVDTVNQAIGSHARHSQNTQWELYEVTQAGGMSEWLIEVTLSGAINTAQAMICMPNHGGAAACP